MDEPVKRICIISRAQIRYEGDFVSVEYHDTCGRTITLANGKLHNLFVILVKSYGTENRPAEKKASPKDVVYEKIMFTENDLVSITFVEEADIIDDPSIVIVEPPYSSNIAPIGTKPSANAGSISQRDEKSSWSVNKNDNLKFEEKKPVRPNAWSNSAGVSLEHPDNNSGIKQNWSSSHKSYGAQQQNHNNEISNQISNQSRMYPNQLTSPRTNSGNVQNTRFNSNNSKPSNRGGYNNYRGGSTNTRGGYRNNNYNNNRRNNNNSYGNHTKENDIPITGEYDLESANKELAAELEKLEMKDSTTDGDETNRGDNSNEENEEEKIVYDSTKSIFDQLSSQMLDKAMGKKTNPQSFREERKLNSTTFGSLTTYNDHRKNYRNYGNYRRGGGGYRRTGYQNNYNRNNHYNSNNTNSNVLEGDK